MNKEKVAPKYSIFSNCIYVIKDAWKNYPSIIFIAATLSIIAALNSILSTYLPSLVARGLENSWELTAFVFGYTHNYKSEYSYYNNIFLNINYHIELSA